MRTGLQNCCTRRTLCTAVFDSILKNCFCLCAPWSVSRQSIKSAAEPTAGTRNRRTEVYRSVQKCTEGGLAVPSRTPTARFCCSKINACEIREDFRRKPNALHHPVIYRSVKPMHRNVVYPTVPHDLTQNSEAGRVLLRTEHHGRKSERICGTVDFSLANAPGSPIRKPITRKMEVKS